MTIEKTKLQELIKEYGNDQPDNFHSFKKNMSYEDKSSIIMLQRYYFKWLAVPGNYIL